MVKQRVRQKKKSLSKMLDYVLGRNPHEFGLIPDEDGFIPIKDLLTALKEEEGWSFVRESHLDDLIREPMGTEFEKIEKNIRVSPAMTKLSLGPRDITDPPALLYHAVRPKGYPNIHEHGLRPNTGHPWTALFTDKEMAARVCRRRTEKPVLLTIQAEKAGLRGVPFYKAADTIYLVRELDIGFISGPTLPKEKPGQEKKKNVKKKNAEKKMGNNLESAFTPGSFFLEQERDLDAARKRKEKRGKKGPDWKRDARKLRKQK